MNLFIPGECLAASASAPGGQSFPQEARTHAQTKSNLFDLVSMGRTDEDNG